MSKKGKSENGANNRKTVVCEKGAAPSYAPNYGRIEAQQRAQFARQVAEAREYFPDLVAGVVGQYLVGINTGNDTEAYDFVVKTVILPETENYPAHDMLVIEGEIEVYGKRIYVPHKWLFFPSGGYNLMNGRIGAVQLQMLNFLKGVLHEEIRTAKQLRFEERQALKTEEEKARIAAIPAKEQVTPENVIPIQEAMRKRDCNPLEDLVEGVFGLYDFSEDRNALVLELRAGKGGNVFVVKEISPRHSLQHLLLRGAIIPIESIEREAPELDEHIRGELALHGIRIKSSKPQKRDRYQHVTTGLPNVHTATAIMH